MTELVKLFCTVVLTLCSVCFESLFCAIKVELRIKAISKSVTARANDLVFIYRSFILLVILFNC